MVFDNKSGLTWSRQWGYLVERLVIITVPFELSLSGNGRPVPLTAPIAHAFIIAGLSGHSNCTAQR